MTEKEAKEIVPTKKKVRLKMPGIPKIPKLPSLPFLVVMAVVGLSVFIWFFCRIEPGADEIAVLIRKTGKNLGPGQVIALEHNQKGIQLDVLAEGRYFKNPYTWSWRIHRILDVPAGKLGVMTRLYGEELPAGQIIAGDNQRGIVQDILRPGKYRINPYAFHVALFDAISISPGSVGVVTSLTGKDVLNDNLPAEDRNTFMVKDGLKGVSGRLLDPGTHYLNPYMYNTVEVNTQSQRFEMSGDDVINFLTLDGFSVTVEGTIEFGIERDEAAFLTHRVGDMDDIIKKIILPRARGFSRIEGSKHPAVNFIVGETRQKFQADLETHLRDRSKGWGVDIKSVLVRKIIVPDEIASINRDRELAVQDAAKYEQQIVQAKSKAELTKQEMLAVQSKEKVEADTKRIRAVIDAQQDQSVRVIAAEKELGVAKLEYDAALFQAESILLTADGQKDAIKANNEAEASVLRSRVAAMGGGDNFARYTLYEKIGPQVNAVLTSDTAEGIGNIFSGFAPAKGGAK
ncbi:SPFH domain-containing protein [Desulfopila aestuarii]|uniref:Regulator of protease activity HflC, stomatin/prohibitin superfamily n=1 Tax=Desulfopila aestuarii DSM 18488 TaxID=1121416 RepID=A0A1M7Y738_9BACT|nr:SPFH domain-containing protein [Desulfopila aestuarii]SHO48452.1 Regulator of protease activity HflC, stomatin/prohibitin superfamily [Desulfopila aestuarii DSM 18488]